MSQHNLPSQWEQYRAAFEADAGPLGFDLTRRESITGEPWTEYAEEVTGQRFGGFIAAAALSEQGAGEAVARVELMETGGNAGIATRIVEIDDPLRERLRAGDLLYTSPQAAQPARVVDERDAALNLIMKMCNDSKEPCSTDPESAGAIRNSKFASIAGVAAQGLGLIRGPSLSTPPAAPTGGRQESSIHAGCSPIHRSQVAAPSQQADHSPDGGNMVEQQAGEVTELRAALWHIKNTAIALSDAQVIALEALAAFEAKKAGQQ